MTTRCVPSDPIAKDREESRFEAFVRRHQRMVWRYLHLLGAEDNEADDLVQETFLRVVDVRELDSPEAYLRSVSRHLLLSARRAARRRPPTVEWTNAVESLVAQEPETLEDERVTALRECVQRLGDRARRAIDLHYMHGHDYRATGRELGLRNDGLKTLLARARQALRECLSRRERS